MIHDLRVVTKVDIRHPRSPSTWLLCPPCGWESELGWDNRLDTLNAAASEHLHSVQLSQKGA